EPKQPVVHSRQRSDSPKTFCPAEDRPSSARRSAIGVMLENRPAILHYQYRTAAPTLGIFCSPRAIRWLDFGKDRGRCDRKRDRKMDWVAHTSRPALAGASVSTRSRTFRWCHTTHMMLLLRKDCFGATPKPAPVTRALPGIYTSRLR